MTILLFQNECSASSVKIDDTVLAAPDPRYSLISSSTYYDSDFSRGSLAHASLYNKDNMCFIFKEAINLDAGGSVWMHFLCRVAYDSDDTVLFSFGGYDADPRRAFSVILKGRVATVYAYDDSNVIVSTVTYDFSADVALGSLFTFDLKLDLDNNLAVFYIDGISKGAQSINLNQKSPGFIMDKIVLGFTDTLNIVESPVSELIVFHNESTLGYRVATSNPVSDGTMTDFSGTYSDIDKLQINSSNSITGSNIGDTSTFNYGPYSESAKSMRIRSVCVASVGDAENTRQANSYAHVAYDGSNVHELNGSIDVSENNYKRSAVTYLDENPSGGDWDFDSLESMEFGVKMISPQYNDITLVNPDAETGNTTGWTNLVGGMSVRSSNPSPYAGSYYFMGGTSAVTVATQTIDMSLYETAETLDNSELTIKGLWQQSSYAGSDDGFIALVAYDENDVVISDETNTKLAPNYVWVPREFVSAKLPKGTRKIGISLIMDRDAGTNNDAYFDAIQFQYRLT